MDNITYKCDPNKNTKCKKTSCVHIPDAIYHYCSETLNKEFSVDGIPVTIRCPHCSGIYYLAQNQKDEFSTQGKFVLECGDCNKLFTVKDDGETIFVK